MKPLCEECIKRVAPLCSAGLSNNSCPKHQAKVKELTTALTDAGTVLGQILVACTLQPEEVFTASVRHAALTDVLRVVLEKNRLILELMDRDKTIASLRSMVSDLADVAESHPCPKGVPDCGRSKTIKQARTLLAETT